MYMGALVEIGDADEICDHPLHPYTQILMSSVPPPDPISAREQKRIVPEGEVPSPLDLPPGCPFSPRCPHATEQCRSAKPPLRDIGSRQLACYLNG